LLALCGEIMVDKRARSVAVVALIVAILWLELFVKMTEKEHTSTIRFVAAISNDTRKLGDLAFDFRIARFIACGVVAVVGIPKHLFDFDSITICVD